MAPSSPQALATTKQDVDVNDLGSLDLDPVVDTVVDTLTPSATTTNLPDAAEAAVAATDAAETAEMTEAAAEAVEDVLEDDDIGECEEDFEKVLCEIIEAVEDDSAALEAIFESVKKHEPCGVKVEYVLNKCVEMEVEIPAPEIVVPVITEPEELDDEEELDVIEELADEKEDCICEISEADIEAAEELIGGANVLPVDVDVDRDTGVVTVTDEATGDVTDKFDTGTLVDIVDIVNEVEEAEDDGEEINPVLVIDEVQETLEDATNEKAEDGIPPNELAEEECCGCCCCDCGCDHDHE